MERVAKEKMNARAKVEIVSLHAPKTKMQYPYLTLRRVAISFLAISTIWHWQKKKAIRKGDYSLAAGH